MKNIQLISIIYFICLNLTAQPTTFSWALRHGRGAPSYSYISPAKDQVIQGPCHAFACVAAVEAMAQIYFNRIDAEYGVNLSERVLYNNSSVGVYCEASDVTNSLNYFRDNGVMDDASFQFPGYCSSEEPGSYNYSITIPRYLHYTDQNINNNVDLKKAILDYGPLVVCLDGMDTYNHYAAHYLYGDNRAHSVLLLGWGSATNSWHIKDSWPNTEEIDYVTLDIFNFSPEFYRIDPDYNNEKIETNYGTCDYLSMGDPVDVDQDGLYNWGFHPTKPSGWSGISLMDFDDSEHGIGFMYNYVVYNAPEIYGPSYVCSGGTQFTLNNIPQELQNNVSWAITPTNSSSPSSGSGCTASITPASYVGKNCKVTFTLTYNGTSTFEKNFVINGPRDDLVSISVLDSYGGTPPKYGGTYYLCPNTTYSFTYNNYDTGCTTSDFEWDLPYGWSENWNYNNTVSINTNDYPSGMLDVKAKTTCCSPNTRVIVYTQYLAEGQCEGDFMLYPNPSDDFVYIDINKNKISARELNESQEFTISVIDRSGTNKFNSRFKGLPYKLDTGNLPKGIYFINLRYGDNISTIRLAIEH
jgi:hypothetical protein